MYLKFLDFKLFKIFGHFEISEFSCIFESHKITSVKQLILNRLISQPISMWQWFFANLQSIFFVKMTNFAKKIISQRVLAIPKNCEMDH